MKLSEIKNNPNNPRVIKDERFQKLVNSIREFPKMMALRPMVINEDNVVLGGNQRLKALKELGYKDIPDEWVKRADDLTDDEKRRFIIQDNVGFGDHDWELLKAEWDMAELADWGVEVPIEKDLNESDLFDIEIPFYPPSEIIPEVNELADLSKTKTLIEKIDSLEIQNELKEILKHRASFFTDFNFQKVADFYHNQNSETQEIFKDLGMVIIAPKEALEKGFVKLSEDLFEL